MQAAEPEGDKGEAEQAEQAEREMHRTLSGRYKNPAIDNMQPFWIESRPSQPLATHDRHAFLREAPLSVLHADTCSGSAHL